MINEMITIITDKMRIMNKSNKCVDLLYNGETRNIGSASYPEILTISRGDDYQAEIDDLDGYDHHYMFYIVDNNVRKHHIDNKQLLSEDMGPKLKIKWIEDYEEKSLILDWEQRSRF